MAEESILATAPAAETSADDEATKAELQRRMEQARESITQTVTEIKDTVANQYQSVKETISETLDWREQFRKRPAAWSVGALSVGFIVGYSIAGVVKNHGSEREDYPSSEESDVWNVGAPLATRSRAGGAGRGPRSYAAQPITGAAQVPAEYDEESGAGAADEESNKPSLYERFKETKAFDRLQDEVSHLGDRFIEQLSTVGQEVVLPALFGKIKELFGLDLSSKKKQAQTEGHARAASAGASGSSSHVDV